MLPQQLLNRSSFGQQASNFRILFHTLHGSNIFRVRDVALNSNLDVSERRKLDGRPRIVRHALLEQDGRVGREVPRRETSGQRWDVILTGGVLDSVRLPRARRQNRDERRECTEGLHAEWCGRQATPYMRW